MDQLFLKNQHCERGEQCLHFEWTKVIKNAKIGPFWRVFENLKLAVKQSKSKIKNLTL